MRLIRLGLTVVAALSELCISQNGFRMSFYCKDTNGLRRLVHACAPATWSIRYNPKFALATSFLNSLFFPLVHDFPHAPRLPIPTFAADARTQMNSRGVFELIQGRTGRAGRTTDERVPTKR